jgi:hypothetical protein
MRLFVMMLLLFSFTSLSASQIECSAKLKQEIMNVIKNDNKELLEKIYLNTALKFAQKILKNKNTANKNKDLDNSIEAYLGSFNIGDKSKAAIESEVRELHTKYGDQSELSKDDFLRKIGTLSSGNSKLTNSEVSLLIGFMNKLESYDMNETDQAITWYAGQIGDKYSMSNFVNKFFKDNKNLTLNQVNNDLASASNDLQYEFSKIKKDTFEKYRDLCIKKYAPNNQANTSSNPTVFYKQCHGDLSDSILDINLLETLDEISEILNPISRKISSKNISNDKARDLQDEINSKTSELDKIVSYYKSPLYKGPCKNITIIDKKKNELMLYDTKGVKQMTFPVLTGKSGKGFDPDGYTRYMEATVDTSNQTTGAGVYSFNRDEVNDTNKTNINEFGGQLYSVNLDNGKESRLAVHSVPSGVDQTSSYHTRMNAFKSPANSKYLTGGCLNLESYNYQIIKNHVEPKCPIIVLPSDGQNYFYVKNNRLNFTSENAIKRAGKDKFTKSSKTYSNLYNFSPHNKITTNIKSLSLGNYTSSESKAVKSYVLNNMNSLMSKNIEQDGLQDSILLSIAIAKKSAEAPEIILNEMIAAQKEIIAVSKTTNLRYNYNTMNRSEKLDQILRVYNLSIRKNKGKAPIATENVVDWGVENIKFNYEIK